MSSDNIEYQSKERLEQLAFQFRKRFGIDENEKVLPIEKIVDVHLSKDIVPLPNLYQTIQSSGMVSSDCTTVWIDERCFEDNFEEKYRFTLAHEIAHLELHQNIYQNLIFESCTEYKENIGQLLSDVEYRMMEWQADFFAGSLLVSPKPLEKEFKTCFQKICDMLSEFQAKEIPQQTIFELILSELCEDLAPTFFVSPVTIDARLYHRDMKKELARELFGDNHEVQLEVQYRDLPNR